MRLASAAILQHSTKETTMQHEPQTIEQKQAKQSTGNRLKLKLETMLIMVMADRTKEAGKIYDQLIAEFDKLA
jgi:hypothetical protein